MGQARPAGCDPNLRSEGLFLEAKVQNELGLFSLNQILSSFIRREIYAISATFQGFDLRVVPLRYLAGNPLRNGHVESGRRLLNTRRKFRRSPSGR